MLNALSGEGRRPVYAVGACAVLAYVLHRRLYSGRKRNGGRAPRPHELRLLDGDELLSVGRVRCPLHIVIVGGGPGGALAACFLAKSGHNVEVLERDTQEAIASCAGLPLADGTTPAGAGADAGGKATGVTLYPRGRRALRACLDKKAFDAVTVPLVGRTLHLWDTGQGQGQGQEKSSADGAAASEGSGVFSTLFSGLSLAARRLVLLDSHPFRRQMHTVNRPGAQLLLLREAQRLGATVRFGAVVDGHSIDVGVPRLTYRVLGVPPAEVRPDCIVGADGAFSAVREAFVRQRAYCVQRLHLQSFSHGWVRVRLHDVLQPRGDPAPSAEMTAGANTDAGADMSGTKLRHDTMHLWPFPAPANGIVISCPQANGNGLDAAIVLPHGPESATATASASASPGPAAAQPYRHGPWHLERLRRGGEAEAARFFREVLPEMALLDSSVVAQLARNVSGKFCSASIAPYHYAGKVALIGDAAHAMTGFWGQGMNMALEDGWRLAHCIADAEREQGTGAAGGAAGAARRPSGVGRAPGEDCEHVARAFAAYSCERCASGDAIVSMSMQHLVWFTDSIGSALYRWRQAYQRMMHTLLPCLYYPPLQHIVHFYDLNYAQMRAIEEEHAQSWSIGTL